MIFSIRGGLAFWTLGVDEQRGRETFGVELRMTTRQGQSFASWMVLSLVLGFGVEGKAAEEASVVRDHGLGLHFLGLLVS